MIKNETGIIEIILFSSFVDQISNNRSYNFKEMRIIRNQLATVSKNAAAAIFVTDKDLSAFSYEKQ